MSKPPALKRRAYDELLEAILGGELEPGHLLNRRGVAQELGMSPAPVHEAMLQLERDGFLEALPRRGTRVRTASREDVYGHLLVREALECQVARLVCGDRLQAALEQLEALATRADAAGRTGHERAHHEVAFHVGLAELTDCPVLVSEYRRIMQIGLFYRINQLMTAQPAQPEDRHLALLQELAASRPAAAADCVRHHLWSGKPDDLQAQRNLDTDHDRTDS